jgi:hypothetical protein
MRDAQSRELTRRLAQINADRRRALAAGDGAAVDRLEQQAFAVKNFYD